MDSTSQELTRYFKLEKAEAIIYVIFGLAAFGFSSFLLAYKNSDFIFGLVMPLFLVGAIQLIVGVVVLYRTSSQVEKLNYLYHKDTKQVSSMELPRMELVIRNLRAYNIMELIFMITGIILLLLPELSSFWKGLGIGLFIQGSIMLVLDIFAQARAKKYMRFLESLS